MAGLPSPADMFAAIPTSAPQQPTVDPAAVERARQQQMLIDALTAQRAQQVNQWPTDGGPLQITVGPPANDPRLYDMPPCGTAGDDWRAVRPSYGPIPIIRDYALNPITPSKLNTIGVSDRPSEP